jgi:hypothetical protein
VPNYAIISIPDRTHNVHLSLRFIIPLAIAIAAFAYAAIPLVDRLTFNWFVRDLDARAALVANSVQDQLLDPGTSRTRAKILWYFSRITQDERLFAIGYCLSGKHQLIATSAYPSALNCKELDKYTDSEARVLKSAQGPLHVSVWPVTQEGTMLGRLVLVHDMSFIERRSAETKRFVFYFLVAIGTIVSLARAAARRGTPAAGGNDQCPRIAAARARPALAHARCPVLFAHARPGTDGVDGEYAAFHPARGPAR